MNMLSNEINIYDYEHVYNNEQIGHSTIHLIVGSIKSWQVITSAYNTNRTWLIISSFPT